MEDQPSQADKMREALSVIAEFTESQRLRGFLETGQDRRFLFEKKLAQISDLSSAAGDVTNTTAPNMPRGLNQLGNTCYLNSLLQVWRHPHLFLTAIQDFI